VCMNELCAYNYIYVCVTVCDSVCEIVSGDRELCVCEYDCVHCMYIV
jgi:hypothetical protein